jgi:hypothetical protein
MAGGSRLAFRALTWTRSEAIPPRKILTTRREDSHRYFKSPQRKSRGCD